MGELRNPHPGEILKQEFLNEIAMSQNGLARAIDVPGNRIHAIVNGTRDITADTDLRLCKFFGLTEGYFLRLQNAYDTLEAKRRVLNEALSEGWLLVFSHGIRDRAGYLEQRNGRLYLRPVQLN